MPQAALAGPTPSGNFNITPIAANFAPIVVGSSDAQTITVHYTGPLFGSEPISSDVTSGAGFVVTTDNCVGHTLSVLNQSCTLVVTFSPTTAGQASGTLRVTDNASNFQSIPLSGFAYGPQLSAPTTVDFGTTAIGTPVTETIPVDNIGFASAVIQSVSSPNAPFSFLSNNCTNQTLTPPGGGASECAVTVQFNPLVDGPYTSSITVTSTTPGVPPVTITLTGKSDTTALDVGVFPDTLHFGAVQYGTNSNPRTFTVFNFANTNATIGALGITGPNSGDFHVTANTCAPGPLAPNTSCDVTYVFTPTSAISKNESATATIDVNGTTHLVTLLGTSLAPKLVVEPLQPTPLDFGNVAVGTTSPSASVSVVNEGNAPVDFSTVGSSPSFLGGSQADFAVQSNGCTGILNPGQACDIAIDFSPSVALTESSVLQIPAPTPSATLTANVQGTGVLPAISVAPNSVNFGSQPIGVQTGDQIVTVTNSASNGSQLLLSGATVTGSSAFAVDPAAGTCQADISGHVPLAAGASCTLGVNFTPANNNTANGTLSVASNAPSGDNTVALTGNGVGGLDVSPSSLNFPDTGLGINSAQKSVTVTYTGAGHITLGTAVVPPGSPFSITSSNCDGVTLDPSTSTDSCTVNVQFQPTALGSVNGVLQIPVSGQGPINVPLSGNGVATTSATAGPDLHFGSIPVNTASPQQTVTVTNTGANPLIDTGNTITGANPASFAVVADACTGQTIAPNGTCSIDVVFQPQSVASLSATLQIGTNAGPPLTVQLTGTGTATPSTSKNLVVHPPVVAFGPQSATVPSPIHYVTVVNTSTTDAASLGGAAVDPSGPHASDFTLTGNACNGQTLAPQQSCSIGVVFTPTSLGIESATLQIPVTGGGILTVPLFGFSTHAVHAKVGPTSLVFDPAVNTVSLPQYVTVTNTGATNLTFTDISLGGLNPSDFVVASNTCSTLGTITPGESCLIGVAFTPNVVSNTLSAVLNITDNAGIQVVTLSGVSTTSPDNITVSPSQVDFGHIGLGDTSSPRTVTVTDTGNNPVNFGGATLGGNDPASFQLANDGCQSQTLDPTKPSCSLTVTFTPTHLGNTSAVLTIPENGTGTTYTVVLAGRGVANTSALVIPGHINFADTPTNTSSGARSVTVVNTGNNPLTVNSALIQGVAAGSFFIASDSCTGTTVAPHTSCNLEVVFQPQSVTSNLSATLRIFGNFAGTGNDPALTVQLSGNGTNAGQGLSAKPPFVIFGAQGLGVPSLVHKVTVTNHGTQTVNIGTAAIDPSSPNAADFSTTADNCSNQQLGAGASCTINVVFTPGTYGFESAALIVPNTNPGGTNLSVDLFGLGVATTTVSITPVGTPPTVTFPNTPVGDISPQQTVTVTNTGINPLVINSDAISEGNAPGDFKLVTDTCTGNTVAPGGTCWLAVSFRPTAQGARTASLLINDNALSNQQDVELSGFGISGATYTVAPSALDFGNVGLGVQSPTQTVTVTNTSGSQELVLPAGAVTLGDLVNYKIVGDTCTGLSLDPGATCTVKVAFDPQSLGTLPAELVIAPQNAGIPKIVDLMGNGVPSVLTFSMNPSNNGTLAYGNQVIDTTSASKTVILTNSGLQPLTVTAEDIVGPNGGQFHIVADTCLNNPGIVLGTCTITIVFKPTSIGDKQAQLQITDNGPSSPQVVNLTGTGVPHNPFSGYWLVAGDGGVFSFGTAHFYGSTGNLKLSSPVVGMASTADGKGYWLVASDGGIFAFGDAPYLGSMGGTPLNSPVVGIAATPDGGGYWEVAADGGIFSFGDAQFHGSMGGLHLNKPVTGMASSADGGGYWLVASDGGIFSFGDVQFYGSMGGHPLNKPVVGIVRSAGSDGYLMTASDGGVFAFGDAPFYGSAASLNLKGPIVGIIPTATNKGYWQIASDGGVFAFGDAPFVGSLGAITLNQPMVGGARSFTF